MVSYLQDALEKSIGNPLHFITAITEQKSTHTTQISFVFHNESDYKKKDIEEALSKVMVDINQTGKWRAYQLSQKNDKLYVVDCFSTQLAAIDMKDNINVVLRYFKMFVFVLCVIIFLYSKQLWFYYQEHSYGIFE